MRGGEFLFRDGAPVGGWEAPAQPRALRPLWACGGPSGKQAHGQDFRAQCKAVVNLEAQVWGAGSKEWGSRALLPAQQCLRPGKCKSEVCGARRALVPCRAELHQGLAPKEQDGLGSSPVGPHLLRAVDAVTHVQC